MTLNQNKLSFSPGERRFRTDTETLKADMLQEARLETSRAIKHTPSSLSPRQSQAQWDRLAWHDIMPCENKQGRYWKEGTERQGRPFSGNLSFPFPYWDLGDN